MSIDRKTVLFFDASYLIAAAGSPSGGSGLLLSMCASEILRGAISQPVLLEAQRNIQGKLGNESLNAFYMRLSITPFILASLPEASEIVRIRQHITSKDVHVVASALEVNAQYLLTLDKRLIEQVNSVHLGLSALLPGDFIKLILPSHVDYPKIGNY